MSRAKTWLGRDEPGLSSVRQALADLLDRAHHLAESDPTPERRARHRKLAQYLVFRIARAIPWETKP